MRTHPQVKDGFDKAYIADHLNMYGRISMERGGTRPRLEIVMRDWRAINRLWQHLRLGHKRSKYPNRNDGIKYHHIRTGAEGALTNILTMTLDLLHGRILDQARQALTIIDTKVQSRTLKRSRVDEQARAPRKSEVPVVSEGARQCRGNKSTHQSKALSIDASHTRG